MSFPLLQTCSNPRSAGDQNKTRVQTISPDLSSVLATSQALKLCPDINVKGLCIEIQTGM